MRRMNANNDDDREEEVLRKIVTSRVTVEDGEMVEGVENRRETERIQFPGEAVPKIKPGFIWMTGKSRGVVKGVASLPETGSDPVNKQECAEYSVACDTPNIPNVVEYHLKVKAKSEKDVIDYYIENLIVMRKENKSAIKKDVCEEGTEKVSRLIINNNIVEGPIELPQIFQVKYLGSYDARGLWGIKHTRKPVDNMVAAAKSLPTGTVLPFIKLVVSKEGVAILTIGNKRKLNTKISRVYPIEIISYGVQDIVYTRVFSMIVVRDTDNFRKMSPFECHGFVCESKHHARQLTYALAAAFQIYSENVKSSRDKSHIHQSKTKRFQFDLRSLDPSKD